jgi:hypothetical protein
MKTSNADEIGGNSFFAARYGFVCDTVENFEVGQTRALNVQ